MGLGVREQLAHRAVRMVGRCHEQERRASQRPDADEVLHDVIAGIGADRLLDRDRIHRGQQRVAVGG